MGTQGPTHRLRLATASTVLACFALLVGASSALAGVGISVVPAVPSNVVVGQSGLPSSLFITNNSVNGAGESNFDTDSFRIDDITLVPSCGSPAFGADCPLGSYDPGVVVPDPLVATGTRARRARAGRSRSR